MNLRAVISAVLLLGIFLSGPHYPSLDEQNTQCHYEEVTLLAQYLADEPSFPGLDGCSNCLHLYVQDENSMKRVLFFAYEHKTHQEWKRGDKLLIKWCYVPETGNWMIRGVRRAEK